jgi:hypothetical protein
VLAVRAFDFVKALPGSIKRPIPNPPKKASYFVKAVAGGLALVEARLA